MHRKSIILSLSVLLTAIIVSAQGDAKSALPSEDSERTPKMLLIGIDGLRPDQMAKADAPRMQALAAGGVSFARATNTWREGTPSNGHSAPNWTALLTGRLPQATGIHSNGDLDNPQDPDRRVDDRTDAVDAVRTVFWHAKDQGLATHTGVFNTWGGIGMDEGTTLWTSGAVIDEHHHPIGDGSSAERDVETTTAAAKYIGEVGPSLTFVHLSQVDAAGHAFTYASPEMRDAVASVDVQVGRLLDAVDSRADRRKERWLVILTSDHGGPDDSTGHGDNDIEATRTIPLILWGDDLPQATEGIRGNLVDVTPTILAWLGGSSQDITLDGQSLLKSESKH